MSRVRSTVIVMSCLCTVASTGSPLRAQSRAATPPAAPFTLRVARPPEGVVMTLTANRASLGAVGANLSQQLGIPVLVGESVASDLVSADFSGLALEAALPLLAPRVIVDQELRQGAAPAPQAIYLLSFVDPEPPRLSVPLAGAQGFFIEGNTEDPDKAKDSDPLQVAYERGLLSVNAKQQPLADVIRVIADVLGVQVDTRVEAPTVVDLTLPPMAPADVLPRLSPLVRALVRFDLNSAERTVLRIVLAPSEASRAR